MFPISELVASESRVQQLWNYFGSFFIRIQNPDSLSRKPRIDWGVTAHFLRHGETEEIAALKAQLKGEWPGYLSSDLPSANKLSPKGILSAQMLRFPEDNSSRPTYFFGSPAGRVQETISHSQLPPRAQVKIIEELGERRNGSQGGKLIPDIPPEIWGIYDKIDLTESQKSLLQQEGIETKQEHTQRQYLGIVKVFSSCLSQQAERIHANPRLARSLSNLFNFEPVVFGHGSTIKDIFKAIGFGQDKPDRQAAAEARPYAIQPSLSWRILDHILENLAHDERKNIGTKYHEAIVAEFDSIMRIIQEFDADQIYTRNSRTYP